MADFKTAYQIVMTNEGGYANNKSDRGGETYKGVSRKNFSTWQGWPIIDAAKTKFNFPHSLAAIEELQKMVLSFYKENFWNRLNLDLVNDQKLANELFDTGVNMGTGVASLFLQRVLNVSNRNGQDYPDIALDGIVGHKTIESVNNHKRPNDLFKALNCLQGAKYISICEANPSQEIFFRSWFSRVFE
jgi:lysozyme family protein